MSKRSLISLLPGWDTPSAMADSRRPPYTFQGTRHDKHLCMLIPVRAGARAQRAYIHTISVHNTTLLLGESEVPQDRTRSTPTQSLLGSSNLTAGPDPIPTIPGVPPPQPRHRWQQSWSSSASDSVHEWPPNRVTDRRCYHYAPVLASSPVSKGSQPYHLITLLLV